MRFRWVVLIAATVVIVTAAVVDAAQIGSRDTTTSVRRTGGALPPAVALTSVESSVPAPASVENLRLVANDGVRFSLAWSAGHGASVFEVHPEGGEASRVGVPYVTLGWPVSTRSITVRVAAVSASGSYSRWTSITVDADSRPVVSPEEPDAVEGGRGSTAGSQSSSDATSEARPGSGQTSGQVPEREASGRREGQGTVRPTIRPTAAPTATRSPAPRPTTTRPTPRPTESAPATQPSTSTKPDPSTPAPTSPGTPVPSQSDDESSGGSTGLAPQTPEATPSDSRTTAESDSRPSQSAVPISIR